MGAGQTSDLEMGMFPKWCQASIGLRPQHIQLRESGKVVIWGVKRGRVLGRQTEGPR